jgi:biotin carboxylase
LNNKQEASQVYSYAKSHSSSGVVIVEEYMKGPEVSVEIIVYENEIHIISITDKMTTGAPHFVELGHKQPSALSEKVKKDIAQVAIKAVKAIGINNSAAHVEIIVTDNGPKLVELGARLGGDCITSHLVPLSTGIDMVKASIDLAMGHKPDLNKTIEKVSMIKYIPSTKGILKNIKGIDQAREIPGIKEVTITKQIGEEVGNIKNSGDRLGYIIVQASSYQEAEEIFSNALTKIIVEVENDENII